MKNVTIIATMAVVWSLITISCTPEYMPNALNVPMMTHKNEVQASMNVSLSGFEPQFSYAASKHIGIMVNGSYQRLERDNDETYHRHHFTEMGIGYYNIFNDYFAFEIYGGAGYGRNFGEFNTTLYRQNVYNKVNRYFVQPSVGLTSDYGDIFVASRLAYLQLRDTETTFDQFFIDPVIGFKVGYKHIKLQTQTGFSFLIGENEILHQPFIFSAGIEFSIYRPDDSTKEFLNEFF